MAFHIYFFFTLCCITVPLCVHGKRVVMMPVPFTSHTRYQVHVARELVRLGHEVWLTLPTYLAEKGYLQDMSGIHPILYEAIAGLEDRAIRASTAYFEGKPENREELFRLSVEHTDRLLRNETLFKMLKEINPDLFVIDNISMVYQLVIIPYRMDKPFAFVGTAYDPNVFRVPFSPAALPIQILPYSDRMAFWQRIVNTFFFVMFYFISTGQSDAVATYAPEMPYLPLDMLLAKAEIWLVEMDHILDYPRPSLPNVKLIGGTAAGRAKDLPPHFRSFMDSATEGMVIVTFGSYVLDVPKVVSEKLFNAFLRLPMKVIFRTKLSSPDPSKILTSSWIPQNDLLGHPNTKVFVSHCGNSGQYEALYHAVPVVATPLFADQPYNAERMRVKGFGETVDLLTVTAEELSATILKVASEPRYKETIAKASRLFRQQFGVPMEEAARWLDHVMEYGGKYMRAASQDIPFYQYIMLDVILLFLGIVHVVELGFCLGVYLCCRKCSKKKKVD